MDRDMFYCVILGAVPLLAILIARRFRVPMWAIVPGAFIGTMLWAPISWILTIDQIGFCSVSVPGALVEELYDWLFGWVPGSTLGIVIAAVIDDNTEKPLNGYNPCRPRPHRRKRSEPSPSEPPRGRGTEPTAERADPDEAARCSAKDAVAFASRDESSATH